MDRSYKVIECYTQHHQNIHSFSSLHGDSPYSETENKFWKFKVYIWEREREIKVFNLSVCGKRGTILGIVVSLWMFLRQCHHRLAPNFLCTQGWLRTSHPIVSVFWVLGSYYAKPYSVYLVLLFKYTDKCVLGKYSVI